MLRPTTKGPVNPPLSHTIYVINYYLRFLNKLKATIEATANGKHKEIYRAGNIGTPGPSELGVKTTK